MQKVKCPDVKMGLKKEGYLQSKIIDGEENRIQPGNTHNYVL